jgi:predicted ArsR family transcriptional regulator
MESFDVLGDSELRATLLFVRGRADPPTADEAASELDVARSVALWRLERLVEAGLLETAFVRRGVRTGPGVGRPTKTYAVAAETAAIEFPRRRYEVLLRLLVRALPERARAARLAEAGAEFAGELARAGRLRPATRLEAALDRVCRALGTLSFQAAVESVSGGAGVIVTPTCPLRPLVVEEHEARRIDEGMWRGLVAAALQGAEVGQVRCDTHDCLLEGAPCRVVIRLGTARSH